jgi:hypothetical protein
MHVTTVPRCGALAILSVPRITPARYLIFRSPITVVKSQPVLQIILNAFYDVPKLHAQLDAQLVLRKGSTTAAQGTSCGA